MDIFERAGNFFTGGGWSSNQERGKADADRKRREEEERRRRAEAARQQAAEKARQKQLEKPALRVSNNPQKTVLDAARKLADGDSLKMPTAPRASSFNPQSEVDRFNKMDVDTQRKRLIDLQKEAGRTDFFGRADISKRDTAKKQLAAIAEKGEEKGGNILTFAEDLFGGQGRKNAKGDSVPGILDAYGRAQKALARGLDSITVNSEEKRNEVERDTVNLLNQSRNKILEMASRAPGGMASYDQLSPQQKRQFDIITERIEVMQAGSRARSDKATDELDPVKFAGASLQIVLDALGFKIGGELINNATKATAPTGNAFKQAANVVMNPSGVTQGIASGSAFGGGYGVGVTAESLGADATAIDYAIASAVGAALGGALGGTLPAAANLFSRKGGQNEVTQAAIKTFEESSGRFATPAEKKRIAEDVEKQLELNKPRLETPESVPAANRDGSTPARAPDAESADPRTREVADSYTTIYNQITNDKNLTPQQQADFVQEARKRHIELLKQLDTKLDEGADAQAQVAQQAQEAAELQQQEQAQVVAQVQQERAQQTQPEPQQVMQAEPVPAGSVEVQANNAYSTPVDPPSGTYKQTEEMIRKQEEIRKSQKFGAKDYFDAFRRQIYDPQLKTQKLDNLLFQKYKQENRLERSQKRLLPSQSITFQTSMINNPNQAVRSFMELSPVSSIIQKHTKEKTTADFDTYRMYRDELWRTSRGNQNTLPVDEVEMATFVRDMDARHPEWADEAAQLREMSLALFERRMRAGAEDPALFQAAVENPFYSPRRRIVPEDIVRPEISGIANRSGKATKARTEGIKGDVDGSIDLYEFDIKNTIVTEAAQRRAALMQEIGFEVTDSAEDAFMRKAILKEVSELADLRDSAGAGAKGAKKTAKQIEAEIKKKEDKVYESISRMLERARGNKDDVLNDVVDRDPRYAIEKKAIEEQKFANLTPQERRDQIKYDLEQLDKKYPSPEQMRREDILEYARSLGASARGAADDISRIDDATARLKLAREEVDAFEAMKRQAKEEGGEAYEELKNYTINPRTMQAEISYKFNGATGKIAIPPGLAKEWAALDSSFDLSTANRVLGGIGGFQKTFWTGMFNPVFQTLQTIRNWGQMFTNAEGVSAFNAPAIGQFYKSLFSTTARNEFRQKYSVGGSQYENATRSIMLRRSATDDIMNKSSVQEYFIRNPMRVLSDVARVLNNVLAHLSNAQRDQVIAGAAARGKRLGYSDELAREAAIETATKVFGDFNRVSRFARLLDDSLLPYAGATQAGVRADLRAFKERPAEVTAKYGLMIAAMTGLVAWAIENGAQEYYDTMEEEEREMNYENSIVIATGTVSRNEDGTWNNIVRIPLTPDFRPLHRMVIESMRDLQKDVGIDPVYLASEVLNYMTGDVYESIYDQGRTDEGRNPLGGLFTSSPITNAIAITNNVSTWDGSPQVDEDMRNMPRTEQAYPTTSGFAQGTSEALDGLLTPIQVDQFLRMGGNLGRGIQNSTRQQDEVYNPLMDFVRPFTGGRSASDQQLSSRTYFNDRDDVRYEITDLKQRRAFEMLNQKRTAGADIAKELGMEVPEGQSNSGMLDSAVRALVLLSNEQVLEGQMKMEDRKKERGEAVNPLFDREALTPEQRNAILTYRQGKIYNSAGQNKDRDGAGAFAALGLDEAWYEAFKQKENAFYESLGLDGDDTSPRTFSGETRAQASPELQAKLDQYYQLAKGTGDRSRFLRANPDILEYWGQQNDFTDAERQALGFKPLQGDDSFSSGRGGGGGGYDPFGLLGDILNVGNVKKNAPRLNENPYEGIPEDLERQLRSLLAARRGGRAPVQLGAESRGNNS